jgi:hypothetical protein
MDSRAVYKRECLSTRSCLDLLGGLSSASPAILLFSGDVSESSHSTGSGGISSKSLGRPIISSLLGVETTTGLGVLSLLEMEVRSSSESGDSMRMSMLQTCCWGTSCLNESQIPG